jgi:glutathione S-transferase
VPVLEWIDQDSKEIRLVPESLIVSSYLDESHPNHPLQPRDPYAKATQQVLIQRFGNVSLTNTIDTCAHVQRSVF